LPDKQAQCCGRLIIPPSGCEFPILIDYFLRPPERPPAASRQDILTFAVDYSVFSEDLIMGIEFQVYRINHCLFLGCNMPADSFLVRFAAAAD